MENVPIEGVGKRRRSQETGDRMEEGVRRQETGVRMEEGDESVPIEGGGKHAQVSGGNFYPPKQSRLSPEIAIRSGMLRKPSTPLQSQ
ncbi:hypothetical protein [Dapis sp. BLCC M172]|uniref:hypothetical protein n=1 Tax=Dapis sp. BLCC M172 TaxID=2975281 RepID=UPI003CE75744